MDSRFQKGSRFSFLVGGKARPGISVDSSSSPMQLLSVFFIVSLLRLLGAVSAVTSRQNSSSGEYPKSYDL